MQRWVHMIGCAAPSRELGGEQELQRGVKPAQHKTREQEQKQTQNTPNNHITHGEESQHASRKQQETAATTFTTPHAHNNGAPGRMSSTPRTQRTSNTISKKWGHTTVQSDPSSRSGKKGVSAGTPRIDRAPDEPLPPTEATVPPPPPREAPLSATGGRDRGGVTPNSACTHARTRGAEMWVPNTAPIAAQRCGNWLRVPMPSTCHTAAGVTGAAADSRRRREER